MALADSSSVATAARRAPTSSKPTILVAEDSTDSREMLRVLLEMKGYNVIGVDDGERAIEAALVALPDLILIDLRLPKLDGLMVTRGLRSNGEFRKTPIVIVSGYDPAKYSESAFEAGCDYYLPKPIDFEMLDQLLSTIVPTAATHKPAN